MTTREIDIIFGTVPLSEFVLKSLTILFILAMIYILIQYKNN